MPITTTKTISLADFAPTDIWFASFGIPGGIDISLTTTEDPDTGETIDQDPWEAIQSLPFDLADINGTIRDDGTWEWDGEDSPKDWNGNTIHKMNAFKS